MSSTKSIKRAESCAWFQGLAPSTLIPANTIFELCCPISQEGATEFFNWLFPHDLDVDLLWGLRVLKQKTGYLYQTGLILRLKCVWSCRLWVEPPSVVYDIAGFDQISFFLWFTWFWLSLSTIRQSFHADCDKSHYLFRAHALFNKAILFEQTSNGNIYPTVLCDPPRFGVVIPKFLCCNTWFSIGR